MNVFSHRLTNPTDKSIENYQWDSWNELHKTSFSKTGRVHYFCHPLYGQEVEILYEYKCGDKKFFVISLFDNSRVFMPAWMIDEVACQNCAVRDVPVCSLAALRQLRQFLDALA